MSRSTLLFVITVAFSTLLQSSPQKSSFDVVSMTEQLPVNLELGDLLYSENIGAYSAASSTWFNGFAPAKVVHCNQ